MQASLFPSAVLIALHTPIYNAYCRFANKFRVFWVPQGHQDPPAPVQEVFLFIKDLPKLRNHAKANKTTAESITREKHCAEKENVLMEVQAAKKAHPFCLIGFICHLLPLIKVKKGKKGKAPKSDTEDGKSVIADVDHLMDDVSTLQVFLCLSI